jgi:protein tyrosine phosphatase (PTP) superfamily phosphohydrolase (DUF442 family)
MEYVHIPVVWEKPKLEDVRDFFKLCKQMLRKKIHCAANKIVSAFIYLYRRLYEGISDAEYKKNSIRFGKNLSKM